VKSPARLGALTTVALAVLHVGLGLLPEPPFTVAMNLVLFMTNLYVLFCATSVLRNRSASTLVVFLAGYSLLWLLLVELIGKLPLFILLVVAYASVFGSAVLLGFFVLFVLCFVVLQPYAYETFLPLAFVYTVLWRARGSSSRFAFICLGVGLLGLTVVLFPIAHLLLQDSAHTLWRTFSRSDVTEAIGLSVLSATIATAFIALFGIPLAYALARLEFRGKHIIEVLIDLPILVPQSVAGVALLVLLGPGSPIGTWLEAHGLGIWHTLAALVIAQVFVAAPFLIKSAMAAFESVPKELELASRSLGSSGAGTFARIALPLASRGILLGAALSWARAVSEYGCVVLFAYSPVSAPVLVHNEFLSAGKDESRALAVVFLITCLWFFFLLRYAHSLLPFARSRNREVRP